jgi:hypothetical protein
MALLAFFAGGKLRRIDLPGGAPVSICDVQEGLGFPNMGSRRANLLSIEGEPFSALRRAEACRLRSSLTGGGEARLTWPVFRPTALFHLQRRRDGSGHLMIAETGQARETMPCNRARMSIPATCSPAKALRRPALRSVAWPGQWSALLDCGPVGYPLRPRWRDLPRR